MKHKIVLGTVQLGVPYGINNSTGKPPERESFEILQFAYNNQLLFLDSADAYGNANVIIGNYHRSTGKRFQVINKFKNDDHAVQDKLLATLEVMALASLYCYMYHTFADYEAGAVAEDLEELKHNKLINKIGVSIYSQQQLQTAACDPHIDIIQLPVNLLDLSDEKIELLRFAKSQGKELHARSVFLQGLFLKNPNSLTGNLTPLRHYLGKLLALSQEANTDIKKIALNYVIHREYIDRVIIGVDTVFQLKENLSIVDDKFKGPACPKIDVSPADVYLLNPSNWQP